MVSHLQGSEKFRYGARDKNQKKRVKECSAFKSLRNSNTDLGHGTRNKNQEKRNKEIKKAGKGLTEKRAGCFACG
jgi:hypothetical protein